MCVRTQYLDVPFTTIVDHLRQLVDEKWCLYVNNMRSPPWFDKDEQHELQPKAGLHPLEVMISTWCDRKDIIHC
ncbi:hypothetical protein Y032_0005g2275 [Ancylostoma ceylanicum]|uniref:Uncharacterized protein n=1 Tax=Ancylostoma ceylanicum TaxID=53326 RepID=A0A016VQW1_9BILA|nr:hypothetical protein Y032_0005g2275 [Ancylostoma ceylanicum]